MTGGAILVGAVVFVVEFVFFELDIDAKSKDESVEVAVEVVDTTKVESSKVDTALVSVEVDLIVTDVVE